MWCVFVLGSRFWVLVLCSELVEGYWCFVLVFVFRAGVTLGVILFLFILYTILFCSLLSSSFLFPSLPFLYSPSLPSSFPISSSLLSSSNPNPLQSSSALIPLIHSIRVGSSISLFIFQSHLSNIQESDPACFIGVDG